MKKVVTVLFFIFFGLSLKAQIINADRNNNLFSADTTSMQKEITVKLDGKTKYTDYKIISKNFDTTFVDTTLTLNKYFKFNYIRKDNFELLPFHNLGQTFSKLGYSFENSSLIPGIGASAKQFNYFPVEAIQYYHVPTPTSELMYRSGMQQGQVLDAFLTLNTSKQLNLSIAYKGLRSLGKYRYALASHGNFRTTFNYISKNERYLARGHFSSFDLFNNENGGLTEESLTFFENNDPNYIERARLEVNHVDADNMFEGKRYYLEQKLVLFSKKNEIERHNKSIVEKTEQEIKNQRNVLAKFDTVQNLDSLAIATMLQQDSLAIEKIISKKDSVQKLIENIKIDSTQLISFENKKLMSFTAGHNFTYETQHYRFYQTARNDIYGDAFENKIEDHTSYQKMNNEVNLGLEGPIFGQLRAKANYFNYNYHYNSILYFDSNTVNDKLKGNFLAVGADWNTQIGNFNLKADASKIISGDLTGNHYKALAQYKKDSLFSIQSYVEIVSKSPEFNKLLFQSDYLAYNWQNNFKNEEIKQAVLQTNYKNYIDIKASYSILDNYTYFNEEAKPVQATETINYLKIKASSSLTYRKFTLDNTVMYQQVSKGADIFRVPEIVTRNTLYYSNYFFKGKPLFIQTGVTFKYFTPFKANAYNPLLSEFVLQNTTEIGDYPIVDIFVNMQVRRTRLYFNFENITASFTGRNYYAAPNYPYRDFTFRFGLVWNFFI
jgi:hypothetical protein